MMAMLSTEPLQTEDPTFQPYCTRNGKQNLYVPVERIHFFIHFPNPISTNFFPALVSSPLGRDEKILLAFATPKNGKRDFIRVIIITYYIIYRFVCKNQKAI
jgi:hypothetical protein